MALSTETRMTLVAAIIRNEQAAALAQAVMHLSVQMGDLIEASKRFSPYRLN